MSDKLSSVTGQAKMRDSRVLTAWSPFVDVNVAIAEIQGVPTQTGTIQDGRHKLAAMRDGVRQLATDLVHLTTGREVTVSAPGGPPSLVPDWGWTISLSHSWPFVVCAISRRLLIGVDVETLSRSLDLSAVRRAAFAVEETCGDAADVIRRWTIKEAVLKAGRRGLTVDPRKVITRCDESLQGLPSGWGAPDD